MRSFLRDVESSAFAMLLAVLLFLLLLFVAAEIADILFGTDWQAVIGIAGMGSGSGATSHVTQALSNRSPSYTPLIANPDVAPLPVAEPVPPVVVMPPMP
jgi:hypothetical protein